MKPTPGSAVFLDTNILVYITFQTSVWYAAARSRMKELERLTDVFWVSRQILREFLATSTRPGTVIPAPPVPFLTATIRTFETRFGVVEDNELVTANLLEILEQVGAQGKQVHDANIVATMRTHRIPYLLSHNTTDFRRYASWITVLPLVP